MIVNRGVSGGCCAHVCHRAISASNSRRTGRVLLAASSLLAVEHVSKVLLCLLRLTPSPSGPVSGPEKEGNLSCRVCTEYRTCIS